MSNSEAVCQPIWGMSDLSLRPLGRLAASPERILRWGFSPVIGKSLTSCLLRPGVCGREQQFGSLRQVPAARIHYNRQRTGGDAQAAGAVMMVTTRDIEALAVRLESRGRSNLLNAQPDLQADLLLAARLIFTWMDEHPFLYGVTLADESGAS